jgi:hypothetical protein
MGVTVNQMPKSFRRRVAAWIAVVAVLCHAVFPAYGMAGLADGENREGLVPVCTSHGVVWMTLEGDVQPSTPKNDAAASICPFCLVHVTPFTPPKAISVSLPSRPVECVEQAIVADAPSPGAAVTPSQSRAPPISL